MNSILGRYLPVSSALAISTALALGISASLQAAEPAKKKTPKTREIPKEAPSTKADTAPLLDVWPIRIVDVPAEGGAKHFMMRIPIKARRGALLEPADVTIKVLFYDLIDGEKVAPTVAKIESKWAEPPVDWLDRDMEELNVEYQLNTDGVARKYYGYVVSVRYKDQVVTALAEPKQLLEQFPP